MSKKKRNRAVEAAKPAEAKKEGIMNKKFISAADALFLVIIVFHLFTREWPVGGTLQTIMDVCLSMALASLLLKYYAILRK